MEKAQDLSDFPETPKPLIPYRNKPLIRWAYESILNSKLAEANQITVVSNNKSTIEYAKKELITDTFQIKPTNSPAETLLECKDIWKTGSISIRLIVMSVLNLI